MRKSLPFLALLATSAYGEVTSTITPWDQSNPEAIVLKNDSFVETGANGYLQLGFVSGEKAGIWVQVPQSIAQFKVDHFRILYSSSKDAENVSEGQKGQIFFQMQIADAQAPSISPQIENAAQVTEGPYWNDVPAVGASGTLPCAKGGQYVGAALEFTHNGAPSVFSDANGIADFRNNLLYAIPGGWKYSAQLGLRGDWILRIVGHVAQAGEC